MPKCIIAEFEVVKVNVKEGNTYIFSFFFLDKTGIVINFLCKALSVEKSCKKVCYCTLLKLFIHLTDFISCPESVKSIGYLTEGKFKYCQIISVKENNSACHVFMEFYGGYHKACQFVTL